MENGWDELEDEHGAKNVRSKWGEEELKLSGMNQKALNTIHSAISVEIFAIISTCKTAKEAWNILENNYEGNRRVKNQRLQQLTTRFEALKMDENETISNFYSKLLSLSNEFFSLGEKLAEAKLVRKILRSLLEKFDYKVIAIEEVLDVDEMKANELIGSLRTFEMEMRNNTSDKKKSVAFKASPSIQPEEEMINEEMAECPLLTSLKGLVRSLSGCAVMRIKDFNLGTHKTRKRTLTDEHSVMSVIDLNISKVNVQIYTNTKESVQKLS